MSIPIKEDLTILQGATFFYSFLWEEGDEDVPSSLVPVNLLNFDAYMHIRLKFDDAEPLCSVDSKTVGEIELDIEQGEIRIRIPPTKTSRLPWKNQLIYDIKLYNTLTKDAYRLREGFVIVKPETTKITLL